MKALRYFFFAILIFSLAYFLSMAALLVGPALYALIFVGSFLLLAALVVGIYGVSKGLWNAVTGKTSDSKSTDGSPGNLSGEMYRDAKRGAAKARDILQEHLSQVWTIAEEDLAGLSIEVQRRSKKSKRFWMKKRIAGMVDDHRNTFDLLSQKMSDDALLQIRVEYSDCCRRINELEKEIADIRASIAMKSEAPGGAYHRLADKAEVAIEKQEELRRSKIDQTLSRFEAYGVTLSPQQAEVLLSRVDAQDIIRMTTVFSIISKMTEQFASAKLQSGENLDVTKKYYGMYIALLELQLFIQNEYLSRLGQEYIPGVSEIRFDAEELHKETRGKIKDSDDKHRLLYEKNLKSQEFTIEVTGIYRDALIEDSEKIKRARELVQKHHDVAENTLKTVQVSADLSSLVSQNESLYREVMELQVPELVPFENLQMQREFEAVTARLQSS